MCLLCVLLRILFAFPNGVFMISCSKKYHPLLNQCAIRIIITIGYARLADGSTSIDCFDSKPTNWHSRFLG